MGFAGKALKGVGCITVAFFVLLGIGLFTFSGDGGGAATDSTAASGAEAATQQESAPPDLELLEHNTERGDYGNLIITGRVRNNSNGTYSYVQLQANVYDSQGTQIGSTLANTNNLRPGRTWRFEAMVMEDEAARYEITDISGY